MSDPSSTTAQAFTPLASEPQFGLIDVIEAFTAMRHEFRNQTMETRGVSQELHQTAGNVERFATLLAARLEQLPSDETKTCFELATNLAEIDHSVHRAVEAVQRSLASLASASATSIQRVSATERLNSLSPITRFFCRRFAKQLDQEEAEEVQRLTRQQSEQSESALAAIMAGLIMTVQHLRRRVDQLGIQRIDVTGQAFDGSLMRAVEVVDCTEVPPGHVAEQLSPAYRYNARVLLYADVRLARP